MNVLLNRAIEESGRKLTRVFKQVFAQIKPGVKLLDLEKLADDLFKKENALASFKMVKNYQWATCLNINQGVVHGIPTDYLIKEGDLVSLDIGLLYAGWHTDCAWSCYAGKTDDDFLKIGQETLQKAIEIAKPGYRIGHISRAIEETILKAGYFPVESLTGHCIGRKLHQNPMIPQFLTGRIEQTPLLRSGMNLAIEVIYTQKETEIVIKDDGWTVETASGCLAALFEETITITDKGNIILTPIESN